MRCPHCAGEIPQASRFCGICGRNVTAPAEVLARALGDAAAWQGGGRAGGAAAGAGDAALGSMSLFALPAARSARAMKLTLVLILDAILAGAGILMIGSFLQARSGDGSAADAPRPGDAPRSEGSSATAPRVEVTPPTPAVAPGAATPGAGGDREPGPAKGNGRRREPAARDPSSGAPPPRPAPAPAPVPASEPVQTPASSDAPAPGGAPAPAPAPATPAGTDPPAEEAPATDRPGAGPGDPQEGTIAGPKSP